MGLFIDSKQGTFLNQKPILKSAANPVMFTSSRLKDQPSNDSFVSSQDLHDDNLNRRQFNKTVLLTALSAGFSGFSSASEKVNENSKVQLTRSERIELNNILDNIEKKSIKYFIDHRTPTGLVLDRARDLDPSKFPNGNKMASLATTGYGMAIWALAAKKGIMPKGQAEKWVMDTLKFVEKTTPPENKGWLTHFADWKTGQPYGASEISSVDTALFYYGAIAAAEYFGGDVKKQVEKMYNNIDFEMMLTNDGQYTDKKMFSHGFFVKDGKREFIPCNWDNYSEGTIIPILALGKEKPEVSEDIWTKAWDRSKKWKYDGMSTFQRLPLFTYFYNHGYLDLKGKKDKCGDDFWNASQTATNMQIKYCKDSDYPDNLFGLTACDGPEYYRAYQPGEQVNDPEHDGTIAPPAIVACLPFNEKHVFENIKTLKSMGLLDNQYGISCAYNVKNGWKTPDALGIDLGSMLLMIDGYRDGHIHRLMNKSKIIKRAMKRAGFDK